MNDVSPLSAGATVTGDSSRPFVFPMGIHTCELEDCTGLLMKPAVCFFWGDNPSHRVGDSVDVWSGVGLLSYVAA